jgi:hypothetical protein
MGRCTVIRWACAAGVLCCWGCSTPRGSGPFGWMQGSSSTQTAAAKDQPNPLKSADSTTPGSDSTTATGDAATTGGSSADGKGSGFKSATIDPALRKLMMDELQYESADKRDALFAEWSKFDPAFIRELVDNHRMAREHANSHQDWANGAAAAPSVKTTSKTPEMPVFDDPTAPNDSVLREHPSAATSKPAPATTSMGAVSPWDDSPTTPPQPPARSTSAAPAMAPTATGAAPASPTTAPPAPPVTKSDPWDADSDPRSQTSVVRPADIASGTARGKDLPKETLANSTVPATIASATPGSAVAAASSPAKGDAFAGLTPVDTDPSPGPTRSQTAGALTKSIASRDPATPGPTTAPNNFGQGTSIQPGTERVVASVEPLARNGQITQTAGAGPFDGFGASQASATSVPAPNGATGADSEQPVKLSPPVDVPDSQVIAATDSGSAGARASQVSATGRPAAASQASATTSAPQSSGLASLPGRLLGAINPLPGGGGSRNVSLPANWHDELQKIVTAAATEAGQTSVGSSDAEKLAYIQKQVNVRMLYLLSGQPARSLEPIAGLEPADQEFWQQVFWGVSNYFDRSAIADPGDRATQTIAQLRAAVHKLQEKSKLELRNVSFCNKIESYGRYERFKRDEFTAGQPVLVYAEVENFKSEPTADGPYRAILKSTIEIFDSRGALVHTMPFAANEDLCASPRRDYYNSYEFPIPQQIALGPHTLKLTVQDQLSQKVASYTVNFTVK